MHPLRPFGNGLRALSDHVSIIGGWHCRSLSVQAAPNGVEGAHGTGYLVGNVEHLRWRGASGLS